MPDNSRLAKLIEQRKRQEKQNDRIRVHKNKLDNMRLEKLNNFYDWSKHLLKHQHLTSEAKCVRNLEKIYVRQCRIEDEKKVKEEEIRKKGEESYRKALGDGDKDETKQSVSPLTSRRRVTSASKQEQAKKFMSKAKSLSSGYRDNDPPQSYYKTQGIVPPERLVSPEVSYSAQAQTGGGFVRPASALHVKDLKKWHGIPDDIPTATVPAPEIEEKPKARRRSPSPPPEREFSLFDALKATGEWDDLDILQEEDESDSGETSSSSSSVGDKEDTSQTVNIRPSTAPAPRRMSEDSRGELGEKKVEMPNSARVESQTAEPSEPKGRGILMKRLVKRPATALPEGGGAETEMEGIVRRKSSTICFAELPPLPQKEGDEQKLQDERLRMRRHSSVLSFVEPPTQRRRSSVATPLALLHRRQSNVAAIHKSIKQESKLLKAKSNKMKKKSGKRMGLIQSVMTNVENDVLIRKMKEKSKCLAEERDRRIERAQSAPAGGRKIQAEEDYPSLKRLSVEYSEVLAVTKDRRQKNKGQRVLIRANVAYSKRLTNRVRSFLNPA